MRFLINVMLPTLCFSFISPRHRLIINNVLPHVDRSKEIILNERTTLDISKLKLNNTGFVSLAKKEKLILFIRHAESYGNSLKCSSIVDPPLTTKGVQQAKTLNTKLKELIPVLKAIGLEPELAIVSPLTRTLMTAKHALKDISIRKEGSMLCCETVVDNSCKKYSFDYKGGSIPFIDSDYEYWSEKLWVLNQFETDEDVYHRCHLFKNYLGSKNQKVILVFTHSNYIKAYVKDILKFPVEHFHNTNEIMHTDNTEIIPFVQSFD